MNGEDVFRPSNNTLPKRRFMYSRWAERIRWIIRIPKVSPLAAVACSLLAVAIIENTVLRMIYGKNHPLNRFNWRRMERRGELSPELLQKKQTVDAYFQSKFSLINTKLTFKGRGIPDSTGLGWANFD